MRFAWSFPNHDDERCIVQPAKMGEGSGRVAGAGADEPFAVVVVHALDGRYRFHVLEAPRGAQASLLRPVAVEGNPEVGEAHGLAQRIGFVGHRTGNVVVGLRGWYPREVLPDTFGVVLVFERFVVHRTEECVIGVVKGVVVVEKVACLQALELILHCFTMPINWL